MKPLMSMGPTLQVGAAGAAAGAAGAWSAGAGAEAGAGVAGGAGGGVAGVCAPAIRAIDMTAPAIVCRIRFEFKYIGTVPPGR